MHKELVGGYVYIALGPFQAGIKVITFIPPPKKSENSKQTSQNLSVTISDIKKGTNSHLSFQ